MLDDLAPVPGRDCGDCTLCCSVLLLDTPQIQKPAGVTCRHCAGGCAIYDTRPPVCRDFYCGWRQLDILGPEWRPDLSGVFAQIETEDIPETFALRTGIGLMLVGNPLRTLRQKHVLDFIVTGVVSDIPLFLSLPGPVGHQAAKMFLNTNEMRAAARARRNDGVKILLEAALKKLRAHDFKAYAMIHRGHEAGGE